MLCGVTTALQSENLGLLELVTGGEAFVFPLELKELAGLVPCCVLLLAELRGKVGILGNHEVEVVLHLGHDLLILLLQELVLQLPALLKIVTLKLQLIAQVSHLAGFAVELLLQSPVLGLLMLKLALEGEDPLVQEVSILGLPLLVFAELQLLPMLAAQPFELGRV